MERLTFLNGDDMPCVKEDDCMEEQSGHYCGPAIDQLAAYEDTGLTPAELLSMYGEWNAMMSVLNSIGSYDRLRELAEADKEGRVVVLPCKVGDTVYEVTSRGTISEYEVMAMRTEMFEQFIAWRLRKGFVDRFCDGIPVGEIGKTVFLTREEAEKALEEAKRNG